MHKRSVQKVQNSALVRDNQTGVLLNTNYDEIQRYRKMKQQECRLNTIEQKIDKLIELMMKIVAKPTE